MSTNLTPVYDNPKISTTVFPAKISLRKNNSKSKGSTFNWHEAIEIYYIIEGSLTLNTNGTLYRLKKGDIGIIGWGMPHRGFDFADATKHYIVQVDVSAIPQLSVYPQLLLPNPLGGTVINQNSYAQNLLNEVVDKYESNEEYSQLESIAALLNFFALVLKTNSSTAVKSSETKLDSLEHIHQMLHYMNSHFLEPITLDELSKGLGLSKSYMCRLFKKHIGQTIVNHLNELRCNYAVSLISSGSSLQDAALQSGFSDYNYFSRTFKQIMGHRPSENTSSKTD